MSPKKLHLSFLIGLVLIFGNLTKAAFPFLLDKDFKDGPKKEWSQSKFERYYRWTERNRARILDDDEQILRRQYAIITGIRLHLRFGIMVLYLGPVIESQILFGKVWDMDMSLARLFVLKFRLHPIVTRMLIQK